MRLRVENLPLIDSSWPDADVVVAAQGGATDAVGVAGMDQVTDIGVARVAGGGVEPVRGAAEEVEDEDSGFSTGVDTGQSG